MEFARERVGQLLRRDAHGASDARVCAAVLQWLHAAAAPAMCKVLSKSAAEVHSRHSISVLRSGQASQSVPLRVAGAALYVVVMKRGLSMYTGKTSPCPLPSGVVSKLFTFPDVEPNHLQNIKKWAPYLNSGQLTMKCRVTSME